MLDKGTKVFGHWFVDEMIGSGAFGTVYKLKREEYGTEYFSALKVISIPPENTDSTALQSEGMSKEEISTYYSDIVMNFMEEIKLLEDLKGNSNIVSYEDHIIENSEDGMSYSIMIRMELLKPFKKFLLENSLDEKEICKLGIDICNALELCEKKKIIHRDIKPDNIFVSNVGTYKLGDFGVARTMEKTIAAMSQKGTYSYMAPEVFIGKEYNQNVDLYSLGILLYQLLNKNRTPFLPEPPTPIKFSDREEAQKRRMSGELLPKIKDVSDSWNNFLLKACHPEPEKRFQTATEMKAVLEKMFNQGADFVFSSENNEQVVNVAANTTNLGGQVSTKASDSSSLPKTKIKKETKENSKKISTKKEKPKKQYLEWLMKETTSVTYTLFFVLISILNSFVVAGWGNAFSSFLDDMLLPAMLVCVVGFIVKLSNFILAVVGKEGFLKKTPLYIITCVCNLAAFVFMYDVNMYDEVSLFIFGVICLLIPFGISFAYNPKRKFVFIITRVLYYVGLFLYSVFGCGFAYDIMLYGNETIAVILTIVAVALFVAYPIVTSKISKKRS